MANTILHKRSTTPDAVPAAGSLTAGELAINAHDGKLFTKLDDGTVIDLTGTFTGSLKPRFNDGGALGVAGTAWSDLYLASNGFIDFGNGDVTLVHFNGGAGDSWLTINDANLTVEGTIAVAASGSAKSVNISRTDTHGSLADVGFLYFDGRDSGGNWHRYGRIQCYADDATDGSEDARLLLAASTAGALTNVLNLSGTQVLPGGNNTIALGNSAYQFADLFLGSGGVINFNNGDVTLTHSSNLLTLGGGDMEVTLGKITVNESTFNAQTSAWTNASFVASGSFGGGFALVDSSAGWTIHVADSGATLRLGQGAVGGTPSVEYRFTTSEFAPHANDGNALGSSSLGWSDLFLASGGTIDWAGGGVDLINSTGSLRMRSNTAIAEFNIENTSAHGSPVSIAALDFNGMDSAANIERYARILVQCNDHTSGSEDSSLLFQLYNAGTFAPNFTIIPTAVYPSTSNGMTLGRSTNFWSELYLADGGTINWNNGDVIITHSANMITVDGGTLNSKGLLQVENPSAYAETRLYRTDAHGIADIGMVRFYGKDSAAGLDTYAQIIGACTDNAAGSEDGQIKFVTIVAGSLGTRAYVGQGFVVGAPTSGDRGAGTINAVSVYDDNVLLTCYALEQAIHGEIDLAFWDAASSKPTHEPARRLAANADELDPDVYEGKWRAAGHLPNMPSREEWAEGSISTGDLAQRLWEVAEVQAVHIARLNQRLKVLEAR